MNVRHNILSRFLGVLTVMVFALLGITSCSETETTDKTDFILYYTSMTDIGPGMSSDIAQPSYKGATPSDFTITGVTLDGQAYTGNLFEINPTSGTVHIESDETTPVGVYKISVSCVAGGSTFTYNDIISVNFLKRVPEGITVTPEALVADFADIIDANSTVELPTAQVTTEQSHISITGYSISSVRLGETIVDNKKNPMFAVSSDGTISIVRGSNAIEPGLYTIDLKLNTAVSGSDSEEGLFANALTVNVTSKPLALTYATGKLEEATEESGNTSFVSQVPTFKGSTDGIAYSIESVSPASDKFVIDAKTGVISVAEGHGLKSGEKYSVSVRVKNDYSTEGVVFNNVFTLNVVEYIEPISNFAYEMTPVTEQVEFEIPVKAGFKGAEPRFEIAEINDADKNYVSIDAETGTISAKKKNKLSLGEHRIVVKATNDKGSETAELIFTVNANPNMFTYISYGNNLGLTPAKDYASQFRGYSLKELKAIKYIPETDIPEGKNVTWKVKGSIQTIKGGRSVTPKFNTEKGVTPDEKFVLDYSRTFQYVNINGTDQDGNALSSGRLDKEDGSLFFRSVWEKNGGGSYSSKDLLTSFSGAANVLAYVDNTPGDNQYSVVVNANKWQDENGNYADGIMHGQMTYVTNGSNDPLFIKNNGTLVFPLVIWLDKNYNK